MRLSALKYSILVLFVLFLAVSVCLFVLLAAFFYSFERHGWQWLHSVVYFLTAFITFFSICHIFLSLAHVAITVIVNLLYFFIFILACIFHFYYVCAYFLFGICTHTSLHVCVNASHRGRNTWNTCPPVLSSSSEQWSGLAGELWLAAPGK